MAKIAIPSTWLLNIRSYNQLASRLSVSVVDLLTLEKKIPRCYHKKPIPKNGGTRILTIPSQKLRDIQRKILDNVLNFEFPNYIHGGIPDRSIVTNAGMHLSQKWVTCLDIQDFFPSVYYKRIYNNFISLNCSHIIARILTHFTTYDYELPQGAPTSPMIANIVFYNLDKKLFNFCKKRGLRYSRYFDDIAISGSRNPRPLIKDIELSIESEGFIMNKKPGKLQVMECTKEQLVTGLKVNGKRLQVSSKELNKINDILDKLILKNFSVFVDKDPLKIKATMQGHLAFLKSINPQKEKALKQKFLKINWDSFCG